MRWWFYCLKQLDGDKLTVASSKDDVVLRYDTHATAPSRAKSMSSSPEIRCVTVWPPLLRLSHWLLAAGVSFELISAWIINNTTADLSFWQDYHLMIGQLLIFVIGLRIYLLVQRGVGHWSGFKSSKTQLQGAGQMLKFYMSLFRFPLPNWFSYNPLWQLVYPFMMLFVLLAVVTGVLYNSGISLAGLAMPELHSTCTSAVSILVLLHVATAILQDWKGKGASISAMLSGDRYFHVDSQSVTQQVSKNSTEIRISADNIKKKTFKR